MLRRTRDLSDITGAGHLTRDTFAVAMKLVREKVSDPSTFQLPDQLPSEYIPPSLRSGSSGSAFPPQQQQQVQRSQPQQDLFDLMGDDDTPSTPTAAPSSPPPVSSFAPLQPQSTGPIQRSLSPQVTGSSFQGLKGTIFPQNTGSRSVSGMISPQLTGQRGGGGGGFQNDFTPSQSTSSAYAPRSQQAPPAATSANFFDDNDLADTTSNLTSLRSQSTQLEKEDQESSRSLKEASKTREELETEVEKVNEQIKVLQDKVSSSRKQLETERNAVEDLKKRESDQKGVLSRARTELISSESDLSGLKMEKSELEGEFLRDKEEVREVKKRLTMVEEEKRILRGEIEKLKKEGRREKGLGAIARKQLVSAETDRGKLEEDFESLKNAPIQREEEEIAPQPRALAVPLPNSTVTSPTASLRSNNPFDKLNLASAGLSPQPTGQSSTSSSNPFPFAASPTTPSFATSPTTPTQPTTRDLAAEEPVQREPSPQVQDSILPIAAAAAGVVGAGALYALETAGSSVTQALGITSPTSETKPELEGQKEIKEEEGNKEEVDPFGVPAHLREDSAPSSTGFDTPASTTNDAGFGDDFGSTSFGDDFASSTETPQAQTEDKDTAIGTLGEVDRDAGFDEAFEELKPDSAKEPEVVEGKLGDLDANEGFDDAFQDFQPGHEGSTKEEDKVEGTLGEVDNDAGFDDAFTELEETHKVDKGKGKEVVRDDDESEDDIFAEPEEESKPSVQEIKGEEQFIEHASKEDIDSSDDEEEGPEDLDRPSSFTRPVHSEDLASTVPEPSTSSAFDSPTQFAKEGNSNSESGESYVHVSSSTAESSGILDADEAPIISPLPVPTPIASPLPVPSQRRAAPPPPTRTSLLTPAAPNSEQAEPTSFPVSDDFDAGFDGTRLRSPVEPVEQSQLNDSPFPAAQVIIPPSSSAQVPAAPEDDFESSFADMSMQPSSPTTKIDSTESSKPDFDTFDDDFDFKPSFDGEPSATPSNAIGQSVTKEDFDDRAFDEFDDSFPTTSSSIAPPPPAATQPDSFATTSAPVDSAPAPLPKGSFDDSFGAFPFTENATSSPPALAPPITSPPPMARMPSVGQGDARDSDSADVKEICGMGFPRSQAIEALAKYDVSSFVALSRPLGSELTSALVVYSMISTAQSTAC